MKVSVEKVMNGYVVTTDDGAVHIATDITSYTYSSTCVATVLKEIFEKKEVVGANANHVTEVVL